MEPSNTALNKDIVVNLIHNLNNNEFGGLKQLTQEERKILKIAFKNFIKGQPAEISKSIKKKISHPRASRIKDIHKTFNENTIKSRTLAEFILNKQNLVDLPSPRSMDEVNQSMWKLLGKCHPVEGTEEIIIAGQVLADGRGDFASLKNIQKFLQKKFPDRTVRIIASSAEKWNKPGALDTSKIENVIDLIFYGNEPAVGPDVPLAKFPKASEILEKAEKAGVVISGVVGMGGIFESIFDKIHDKSIKIEEHDRQAASKSKKFESTTLQMGIDPRSPDRTGIFVNKEKTYTWHDLKNTRLRSILFDKSLDEYMSSRVCFFGYMSHSLNSTLFIRDAVTFASIHFPEKSIDICIPGYSGDQKNGIKDFYIDEFLSELPISQITVIWYENEEKKERVIPLSDKGHNLRIIDPGSLSQKDFKVMTSISAPLVGCTGDNSLAQVLSFGKIPSYERKTALKAGALLRRIEDSFGKDSDLYQYCVESMKEHSQRTSEKAELPNLIEDAKNFGKLIREESSFQPILKGAVNEKLMRQKDKDFAKKEDRLQQAYLNNRITIEELNGAFKALLLEKGLLIM